MKCFIVLAVCLFVGASGEGLHRLFVIVRPTKELCFMYQSVRITVKHSDIYVLCFGKNIVNQVQNMK